MRKRFMFVSTADGTIYLSADAGMKWEKAAVEN
jgi:hypothetical protein